MRLFYGILCVVVLGMTANCDKKGTAPANDPASPTGNKTEPIEFGPTYEIDSTLSKIRKHPGLWMLMVTSHGCGNCDSFKEDIMKSPDLPFFGQNEKIFIGHFEYNATLEADRQIDRLMNFNFYPCIRFLRVDSAGNITIEKERRDGPVNNYSDFWNQIYAISASIER